MYVSLRKVRMAEDLAKRKIVAQLEGEEPGIKVRVTVEAEQIYDLRGIVEDLGKGAVYELELKAVESKNAELGQFFEDLMEEEV